MFLPKGTHLISVISNLTSVYKLKEKRKFLGEITDFTSFFMGADILKQFSTSQSRKRLALYYQWYQGTSQLTRVTYVFSKAGFG